MELHFRLLTKNVFRIKPVGPGERHSHLKLVDWRYTITTKELYQITETKLLKDFQQQQNIKWITHII